MTREEKHRLLDELTAGTSSRTEETLLARAADDAELKALMEAERAMLRAVERDRATLMTADAEPSEMLLARLAATPGLDTMRTSVASSASGSRLSARDIAIAIGIMILLGALTVGTYYGSGDPDRAVPATTRTTPIVAPGPRPEPTVAGPTPTTTKEPTRRVRRTDDATTTQTAAERPPHPAQTPDPTSASDRASATAQEQPSRATTTEQNKPPVFNDPEVRFEIRMNRDERP